MGIQAAERACCGAQRAAAAAAPEMRLGVKVLREAAGEPSACECECVRRG